MVSVENVEQMFQAKAQNNQNQNLTNRSFAPLPDELFRMEDHLVYSDCYPFQ